MDPDPLTSSGRSDPPPAFVTVDVDGLWALRKCYGQPRADTFERDPVWDEGVPWLLDTFDALGVRATFFLVAHDLEVESKRERAEDILRRGHEIGNHSLVHRLGMSALPMGELMEDLLAAQQMFEEALGVCPRGFRSPGYDLDARLLRAVRRAGFLYDSSLLPTWWGPLFRLADWWVARRINLHKRQFGRFRYGWAPLGPFRPPRFALRPRPGENTGDEGEGGSPVAKPTEFWELPISVTPRLRFPVGAGYVLMAGKRYFPNALDKFHKRHIPVNFLIHGADVTDLRSKDNRVFPGRMLQPAAAGFRLPAETKRRRLTRALRVLTGRFRPQRMDQWVREQMDSAASP